MTTEPQTPTQPRRRQRQEIPWRCVGLRDYQIIPLRQLVEGADRNALEESESIPANACATHNFCVHTSSWPTCPLDGFGSEKIIIRPVLSTDFFLYEKTNLDNYFSNGKKVNTITLEDFEPETQYWVRLSCQRPLLSKLDPRKTFDERNPIIGFFSSQSRENCYLIIIEKQDAHGCGCLDIYTFEQQQNRAGHTEPAITHRRFSDLEYSMLDHYLILSDYDVTESEIQAKTLNTTLTVVNELERQIQGEERQLVRTRVPASASKPQQIFLRIGAALFGGDTPARLNTLSWCMELLLRSGVLHKPRLNSRLEIWQRADYGRLFLPPPPNTDQNPLTRSEDDASDISALSDLSNANQATASSFCFPWRKNP